jgi:hypothetical protein
LDDAASLTLLIVAPEFDTSEVTAALSVVPDRTRKSGDQVVTPKGTIVTGSFHSDAAWSYTWPVATKSDFDPVWQQAIYCLERGRETLLKIRGGNPYSLMLILRSSGPERCGAILPYGELSRLVNVGVDFSFEIFAD